MSIIRKSFFSVFLGVLVLICTAAEAAPYRDGIYQGAARDGVFEVELKVVIEGGRIKDIHYLEIPDWETETVKSTMSRRIIEKQSTEVDGVTRATVSSNLIKKAVAAALSRARTETPPPPKPAPPPKPVAPSSKPSKPASPHVILETTQGKIEIALFPDKAPRAVENFLGLVKKGYYDGILFHRVIPNFMIQGGDPSGFGYGGKSLWGKPFKDEFSPDLKFDKKGIVAMANSGPDTNGSQFFITVARTPHLNNKHTIFGEVVGGYDVVEKISLVPTGKMDRPKEKQEIIKAVAF